jgi:aldose 1-epimerase
MKFSVLPHFAYVVLFACFLPSCLTAGEISKQVDAATGWEIYTLKQNGTVAKLAPSAGANLFSIEIDDVQFLRQPESLEKLVGGGYGNPVLYPTPNRVKASKFTFRSREFVLDADSSRNFIHGVVRSAPWKVLKATTSDTEAEVTCEISFEPGQEHYRRFPLAHRLLLTITVRDRFVRWAYEVDNREGKDAVPFGFALHPYFVYQGDRAETYLTIPATHWMESEKQMPSGKLVEARDLKHPLGSPMSLEGTTFDDVFFGMRPENPTLIDFRGDGKQIEIKASAEFTHLVVWTPNQPHFGIESQTCSTDAHNLGAQGHQQAAHLQVCEPGQTKTGWVEYTFVKQYGN